MRKIVPCSDSDPSRPEMWEGETMDFEFDNVELSFSADKPSLGKGSLFVTSKRVIWWGEDAAYDFDVPYIALHAITRDPDSFPKPCVYCQLDCEYPENGDDEEEEDEPEEVIDELFLVPSSDALLKDLFDALSAAALNNPDPPEEWEQEGDDELIYNTEEVELGAEQARTLEHLESVFNVPDYYANEGEYEEEGGEDIEVEEDAPVDA